MFNYEKLRQCIDASGKTKTYLCEKLGRKPYYLRDVLKQKNTIPDDLQIILAEELGTTVAYLNDETDIKEPTEQGEMDEVTRELFDIVLGADDEERAAILEVARLMKKRRPHDR